MIAEEKRVTIPFIKSILKPVVDLIHTKADKKDVYAKTELANVATSGSYTDLTNTPTLAAVATSGSYADLSGTPELAAVATSGSYTDLSDVPVPDATLSVEGSAADAKAVGDEFEKRPVCEEINKQLVTDRNGNTVWEDRTHYYYADITTESVLSSQTVDCSNLNADGVLTTMLEEGKKYTVVWDNVSYECMARSDGYDAVYIGNQAVSDSWSFPETIVSSEPFFIASRATESWSQVRASVASEHTLSITMIIVQETIGKLDEKYIPESIPKMELQTVEGVPETTIEVTDNDLGNPIENPFAVAFEVGVEYVVTWDAVEYKCVAYELEGANVLGNAAIPGIGSDTGEPFCIASLGGQVMLFVAEAGTHTISIGGQETYKIRKEDLPDLNTTVVGYVKSRGSYGIYDLDTTLGVSAETMRHALENGKQCVVMGAYYPNNGNAVSVKLHSTGDSRRVNDAVMYTFTGTATYAYAMSDNEDRFNQYALCNGWIVAVDGGFVFWQYGEFIDSNNIMLSFSDAASSGYYRPQYNIRFNPNQLLLQPVGNYSKTFSLNIDDTGMPTITDTSDATNVWSPADIKVDVDTTLSVEGAAADAKAVGNALVAPRNAIALIDQVNGYIYNVSMRNGTLVSTCAVETIEVASMPTTVEYTAGDAFDPSGLILMTTRYDGTTAEVTDFTYDAPEMLTENITSITVTYMDMDVSHTVEVPITVNPFDPEKILVDFEYTDNGDGTYTLTGWKGTNNGEASTEMIIPNNSCIIV